MTPVYTWNLPSASLDMFAALCHYDHGQACGKMLQRHLVKVLKLAQWHSLTAERMRFLPSFGWHTTGAVHPLGSGTGSWCQYILMLA